MISPELLISMIDDLPNSLQRVETSLFADDSSLYKGGRSIKLLQSAVQQDLDALQQTVWQVVNHGYEQFR